MKRIFLIGDSIRQGYDSFVRENLAEKAHVYWAEDNARFVQYTFRYLAEWMKSECDPNLIDIVHWNNGLWDVLHQMGDESLIDLEDYEKYLRRIIKRLRQAAPHAKICFALTTQVVEESFADPGLFFRSNRDIEAYNAAARNVMAEENIPVDDLYTVSAQMPKAWHSPDGTHFLPEGYQALGKAVADFLEGQM